MEQLHVILFNRSKGLLLGLLTFCICAAVAVFLPHLFRHPSNTVFFFSGVIFIVFPLIISIYISKRCLTPALLTFDESGFSLQRTPAEYSSVVHWQDAASFRMQPFKILLGRGIRLKIYYSDGKSLILYFFGTDLLSETADEQQFIHTFFRHVNEYNLQVAPDYKIMLLPGFFATESGKYLMGIPLLLVFFDLYYRAAHPLESKRESCSFSLQQQWLLVFGDRYKKNESLLKSYLTCKTRTIKKTTIKNLSQT